MFNIDVQSRTPAWEQVVNNIEEYVRVGILRPGDRLPSIRELTAELGINPNTIQKAYNELNSRNITVSVAGRGCFVSRNVYDAIKNKAEKRLGELEKLTKELYLSGISREDISGCVIKTMDVVDQQKK